LLNTILPRALTRAVEKSLALFPVVVVTGARQTGKSTLVRDIEPPSNRTYVTLDTVFNRNLAVAEPQTLLTAPGSGRITIDEVQRAPDLLLTIKESVDQSKVNGRFLLTGSANLLLMQRVSESLAGRASYLTLWPMTRREQHGEGRCGVWDELLKADDESWLDLLSAQPNEPVDWKALVRRGGFPTPTW